MTENTYNANDHRKFGVYQMGIRCYCPHGHKLNVKAEQAGKIGICPKCRVRFQIPLESTRQSHSKKSKDAPSPAPSASAQGAVPRVPSSPASADAAVWYILGGDGRQYGPVKRSVIGEWIAEHRVVAGTIVWTDGTPQKEAREVFPELLTTVPSPAVPAEAAVPTDELDALRRAARDSQKNALQKRAGLNRKKKSRRDLFIVIALSVVILILLGILILLLIGGSEEPESVQPTVERPAASAPAEPPASE